MALDTCKLMKHEALQYPFHAPDVSPCFTNLQCIPVTSGCEPWYQSSRESVPWLWFTWAVFGSLCRSSIPSGKHTKSYGKSPSLIGKSTINGPFSIAMQQITRGYCLVFFRNSHVLFITMMTNPQDNPKVQPPTNKVKKTYVISKLVISTINIIYIKNIRNIISIINIINHRIQPLLCATLTKSQTTFKV